MSAPPPPPAAAPRVRSFARAVVAVLSAFFGVRKGASAAADARDIRPVHVVVAGVVMAALFVGVILLVVQSVLR